MKNFAKFLGIAVMVAVIGFSFAACGDDDNGGGGGGPIPAQFRGDWYRQWVIGGQDIRHYHVKITASTFEENTSDFSSGEWTEWSTSYPSTITRVEEDASGGYIFYEIYSGVEYSIGLFKIQGGNLVIDDSYEINTYTNTAPWDNGGGNPEWPAELMPTGGQSGTTWGKTSYPNPGPNINFYVMGGNYMQWSGSQLGYRLISVTGQTITVKDNSPSENTYTLCTGWTITGNNLTLTGGDAHFSAIMNVAMAKN